MKRRLLSQKTLLWLMLLLLVGGCAKPEVRYHDPLMDFGAIQSVAVMPFGNLTREQAAAERVRDVFMTMLLATEAIYVIPPGEVARGISRASLINPTQPSSDEVKKFAGIVDVDAVITGVVREYGEVRSGSTAGNVVAVSLQMMDRETGAVVWSASSTKGGISWRDRMFGGGGEPMNVITQDVVDELLDQLFQ